jgi:hypothetical protein
MLRSRIKKTWQKMHQGDSIDAGIRSNLWIISMMQIGVVKTKPWGSFES